MFFLQAVSGPLDPSPEEEDEGDEAVLSAAVAEVAAALSTAGTAAGLSAGPGEVLPGENLVVAFSLAAEILSMSESVFLSMVSAASPFVFVAAASEAAGAVLPSAAEADPGEAAEETFCGVRGDKGEQGSE